MKLEGEQTLLRVYLRNTPLRDLFDAQVPFSFADERRFEHMHVIGGPEPLGRMLPKPGM